MKLYRDAVKGYTPEDAQRKFGWRDKLSYALGDFGCNMSFALNAYLLAFWTQFMGLSMVTWGILILCLKIWDAINDPIMGGLMDYIRPKKGQSKFKPWIFWGSFALLFTGALCFIPIQTAPMWLKILICVVGYVLWDMSYTIVNVPYGSLNSVITTDSGERAQLSTWRSIGSMIANLIIMLAVPAIIYTGENQLLGGRLIWVGLALGVVGIVSFQLMLRGTTERITVDYERQKEERHYNYFRSVGAFFKNGAAVSLTIASIFQLLALTFMQSVSSIFIQVTFEGMSQFSGIIGLMGFLPAIIFIPFIKKIVDRFGKKEASTRPLTLGILAGVLVLLIPVENLSPVAGMAVWVLICFFIGLSISVVSMVGWAMVADCIDYQELKTGVREEGVVYATYSLGRKIAQGIGASLVGFLLALTTYDPEMDPIISQAPGTSSQIRYLLAGVYIVAFCIQFFVLLFGYRLTKSRVAEMEKELHRTNDDLINTNPENE